MGVMSCSLWGLHTPLIIAFGLERAMQELSQNGSVITRELTPYSISGFEAGLGDGWSYLASAAPAHAVYANKDQLSLVTYCEGDVITKTSPNEYVFILEQALEIEFALNS
jgi:hypothetical protein